MVHPGAPVCTTCIMHCGLSWTWVVSSETFIININILLLASYRDTVAHTPVLVSDVNTCPPRSLTVTPSAPDITTQRGSGVRLGHMSAAINHLRSQGGPCLKAVVTQPRGHRGNHVCLPSRTASLAWLGPGRSKASPPRVCLNRALQPAL